MDAPLRILVAEDDSNDIELLSLAFKRAGLRPPVHFAQDGREVVDYLEGKGRFTDPVRYPLPHLLLLDLKLPCMDGFEVLEWIRCESSLKLLLVIVLSASEDPADIERAYALGANCYLVKPQDPGELADLVRRVEQYWLDLNVAPSSGSLNAIVAGR